MRYIRTLTLMAAIALSLQVQAQSWWQQTSNTTHNVMDIEFYNNSDGFAVAGSASTIIKTTDQGAQWSMLMPAYTRGELQSIAFVDANTLIAVGWDVLSGDGVIMRSTDGGTSWTTDSTMPEKFYDVEFANTSKGWIAARNGYVFRTTNGGTNWSQLTRYAFEDLFALHFVDANQGWVVGDVDTQAIILHTEDGGTTWMRQYSDTTEPLFAVHFVDSMTGYAAGAAGVLLKTTNGGGNWLPLTSGVNVDLFDIHFIDALTGWAVGGSGTVITTSDGGATWTAQAPNTAQDIHAIHMRHDSLGWLSADAGDIEVYAMDEPQPNALVERSFGTHLQIYPNPADEYLFIKAERKRFSGQITLYDITGQAIHTRTVQNKQRVLLSLQSMPNGLYLLKIKSQNGQGVTRKIFVH